MYLYRATGDPYLLEIGEDMLRSIQHSAKTPCGFATVTLALQLQFFLIPYNKSKRSQISFHILEIVDKKCSRPS